MEPPGDESYLPGGQSEHTVSPSPSVYLPLGQDSQFWVVEFRKVPVVQTAHVPLECELVGPLMDPLTTGSVYVSRAFPEEVV